MDRSERLERLRDTRYLEPEEVEKLDEVFADRLCSLLNHPKVDEFCMIDAYYYDFSSIPNHIRKDLNLYRDHYFIFGITRDGEMVSKWVDRWDVDSDHPVVNGKVIRTDSSSGSGCEISKPYE